MSIVLRCARCGGDAVPGAGAYACDQCKARIPLVHGVAWLGTDGPPPLLPLARDARERGWLQAAHSRLEMQGLGVGELMTRLSAVRTERLGDWQFLVEPATEGPALLMGDPWGAHMTALSREARPLVVFEQDPEAAQYLGARAEQESLASVNAILCGDDARSLPFGPGTFSMVALVGPWLPGPSGNGSADPLDEIIARAFCLLRKGGTLILGVPNRLRPDLALRGRERGKLSSTLPALRSRIAQGGFESPQLYLPVPDFTDIQGLVSLDSKVALRYFHIIYRHPRARWKRVLLGAAIDAGLIAVAAPSYMAIARKP